MKRKLPYLRVRRANRTTRIEVMADSMRVGKSTAVSVIAAGLRAQGKNVTESYEDWESNPYLFKSYGDPANNFLDSQKWFAWRKWEQLAAEGEGIFIQDVAPEMDYCYAETNRRLGRMSEEHFAAYHDYYHSLDWSAVGTPTLLVYLLVSDEELIRRATASRREFETVEPEYHLMMKQVNREWLAGAKENNEQEPADAGKYKILLVDTDTLDFANTQAGRGELVERVSKLL